MTPYIAEFVGTALLLLLGDGVVANVILKGTKGEGAGWITITWGWGMAVFVAVFVTAAYSGAHINPAVTIGLAVAGKFAWAMVPGYIVAQVLGAMAGAFLVWLQYRSHFDITEDPDTDHQLPSQSGRGGSSPTDSMYHRVRHHRFGNCRPNSLHGAAPL